MDKHPITLEEQRKVWTIHRSVNGLTYYYNRATKKSQYEMPQCFKTTQETLEHPEWKEYRTADGKKFYYNAVTRKSVWQLPNEVKQWRIKMQQARRLEKLNQKGDQDDELLNVSDEQKKKFISLLRDRNIGVNTKWDTCIKLCEEDDRWKILKTSQKKRIYLDFTNQLKKIENIEKKAKLEIHKANFLKMLTEHKNLTSDCKMHKVVSQFAADPRWRALEETERQNVFQVYMDQLLNKQKQEAKQKKKQHTELLRRALQEQQISYRMKWDQFKQAFGNNEHYKGLHPYDRLNVFVEYILETEKKFEQQQHREKNLRQRKNRENFRQFLLAKLRAGKLNHKTRWRAFVRDNREQKALIEMMDPMQQGSSAHQLFEQIMQGIRENHKTFKSQIKQHFKSINFKMQQDCSQQLFQEKLKPLQAFWSLKSSLRDYFFIYFRTKIKSKNTTKEISKKHKKQKKALMKIFKGLKDLKYKSSLSEFITKINAQLKNHVQHVVQEDVISKYFYMYTNELEGGKKKKRSKSKDSDSDSSQDQKRKRRRKRKDSDSSDEDSRPIKQQIKPVQKKVKIQKKQDNKIVRPVDNVEDGQIKEDEVQQKSKLKIKVKGKKSRKKSQSSDSD